MTAMANLGDVQADEAINFNIGFAAMQAEKNDAAGLFDKAIEAGSMAKCHEFKELCNKLKDYPNALASYEKGLKRRKINRRL